MRGELMFTPSVLQMMPKVVAKVLAAAIRSKAFDLLVELVSDPCLIGIRRECV